MRSFLSRPRARELVVHANYILIYDLNANSVRALRALRVLHAARQWPSEPYARAKPNVGFHARVD